MKNNFTTNTNQTYEEFIAQRRKSVGGSDIGKVLGVSRWGCARSVCYDKIGTPKDFPDDDKAEFRRGHRLEGIASNYYEEVTGRSAYVTVRAAAKGRPHLAVNMDRLIYKEEDEKKENPGYLELKVVGRWSMNKIKKEGAPEDWLLQVQYGCAVKELSWGALGIYCPETDEFLQWDVEAHAALGETILEKADDFYTFNVECRLLPEPLPSGSQQCEGCAWALTCRGAVVVPASQGVISRPDLESLVAKFAEVKGMGTEAEDAAEGIREEILATTKGAPGTYQCGKWEFQITQTKTKRFNGEKFKKADPKAYESYREESITTTVKKPKEV